MKMTEIGDCCLHQDENNNQNDECKMCSQIQKTDQNDLLQRRNKNRNGLERSLTINIPNITPEKPTKVKRASSSVIRRSPNNKVLYRIQTPTCVESNRKFPLSMRPPTPYLGDDDKPSRSNKRFSFDDVSEDTKF